MDYLFFDIECANCFGGRGKICSFGYIITDDKFNVKQKNDILINPHSKFHLHGHGNHPGIVLGYDEDEFLSSPDFKFYYPTICELLTRENTLKFGFSVLSDANFIKSECLRFSKPIFNYDFIDIQRIYTDYKALENTPALIKCAGEYGVTESQDVHKSDDDAYFTMRVLKGLCEETGLSASELIEKYPLCKCWCKDGELGSEFLKYKEFQKANKLSKMEKLTGSPRSNWIHTTEENATTFSNYVKRVFINRKEQTFLLGKKVCISSLFEEYHFYEMMNIVSLLASYGAKYSRHAYNADIFVTYEIIGKNGEPFRCYRKERAIEALAQGKDIEFMELDTLLLLLNTDLEAIKILNMDKLSPIKNKFFQAFIK
ncbi:MAG: hypothetical protein E7602_07185 [Ruminococcaceae bacterium]|nr:hypothetical protein [Oscillospiraceae bacterium]